jgi:hypothetical protein
MRSSSARAANRKAMLGTAHLRKVDSVVDVGAMEKTRFLQPLPVMTAKGNLKRVAACRREPKWLL